MIANEASKLWLRKMWHLCLLTATLLSYLRSLLLNKYWRLFGMAERIVQDPHLEVSAHYAVLSAALTLNGRTEEEATQVPGSWIQNHDECSQLGPIGHQ